MKKSLIYIVFALYNYLPGEKSHLDDIIISSKKNGIIIEFISDSSAQDKNITGWQSKTGWFYITLYKFDGDSTKFYPKNIPDEISKFQIIKLDDSIQIGIRTFNKIDYFEYQTNKEKNSVIAILHYSKDILASMVKNDPSIQYTDNKRKFNGIKKWLYLTGSTITTSAFLNNNNDKIKNIQLITGSGIITITAILDLIGYF